MISKIKDFISLSSCEKSWVYKFVNRNKNINELEDLKKLDDLYNLQVYDYGRGVLFYIMDDRVVASISIVLEVAKELKAAYIHQVNVLEDIENKCEILVELINRSKEIAIEYGATNIRLGLKDDFLLGELEKLNLKSEYTSLIMNLEDRSKKEEILELEELSYENKYKYVEVYRDSFSDMPHGTITDIEKVEELFKNRDDKKKYFMALDDDKNVIGFMEATLENGKGSFDIGLCKEYRGKGYGKRLLETAIDFLNKNNVEEIFLIVIQENQRAYNMYLKRGFKEKEILGHWIKLTDGE